LAEIEAEAVGWKVSAACRASFPLASVVGVYVTLPGTVAPLRLFRNVTVPVGIVVLLEVSTSVVIVIFCPGSTVGGLADSKRVGLKNLRLRAVPGEVEPV